MQLYLNPFSPSPWFTEDDVKYIINTSLHFGCSQNWLFSDTFCQRFRTTGLNELLKEFDSISVEQVAWRTTLRYTVEVDEDSSTLVWPCFGSMALSSFAASELRGSGCAKISKMFSFIFCIFCDVADLIGGIREWLSFLFTCENQLMLALLKEKHFQALGRCTMQWLGQFMRTRCNLESQSLPLSCTTLTQALIIPSIPLTQVAFSRCFHGMPIHISSSSRPSTTLHIGWVPSRKGSLMLRIWNENAKPWKASLRNSDAWRSVDRIFFRWIQMWNTLGNFVQKYVLIFDYLFVVWALISPCVALLILFVVCKRISVERLWVTY